MATPKIRSKKAREANAEYQQLLVEQQAAVFDEEPPEIVPPSLDDEGDE